MTTPAAPVVTPSVLNAPKNGATQQTQPSSDMPKPNGTAPTESPAEAALRTREEVLAKRERTLKSEIEGFTKSKGGLGQKLSEYEQLKKWKTEREADDARRSKLKLNVPEYLRAEYGDKAQEIVTSAYVNGVAPTELIEARLQQLNDSWEAKFRQRDEEAKQQVTASERRGLDEARAAVSADAREFYEANANEYPVFAKLGDAQSVSAMLAQRIESEFARTGKLLSVKDAAEALESEVLALTESALEHEKYKSKLQDKLKPATIQKSSEAQGVPGAPGSTRRTLGNHLTASTSERPPPRTDDERLERSIEAFNAAHAKGKS